MTGPTPGEPFAAPSPRERSWAAVATSASLHVAVMALIAALAGMAPAPAAPREYRPVTFVMMAPPAVPHDPEPPLAMPVVPKAEPEPPAIETTAPLELPKPAAPPPAPEPVARSEPAPAPPEPVHPARPPVVTPAPASARTPPTPVTVGLFADSTPTVHDAEPAKAAVRSAGFDAPSPAGKTSDTKSAPTVGAFDQQVSPPARVARSGAGVASAGFGSSQGVSAAAVKPPAEVRPSGFDTGRPAPATQRVAPPPDRIDVPVEITFKPAPIYTNEARTLQLEGEVLLDVEFGATGVVSVLQVVRGLGHGLDEAATRAAAQIRFKPAQSSGRPIAFRTTVHIVFRLA